MRKIKKRHVLPVYFSALTWLCFALFLPLYKLWHFLLAFALSAAVYFLSSKLFPPSVIVVNQPVKTGDPQLDAVIREGELALNEMGRLYAAIPNPAVKAKIIEIMGISDKIIANANLDPSDIPAIRKFLSYYLPTTIKLLNAYDRMFAQGIDGQNISATIGRIEDMLDTIADAFKKQLDALFAHEALDIETDIDVLDAMLRREGFRNKDF